jgi:hypothetical protein
MRRRRCREGPNRIGADSQLGDEIVSTGGTGPRQRDRRVRRGRELACGLLG